MKISKLLSFLITPLFSLNVEAKDISEIKDNKSSILVIFGGRILL